MPEPTGETTTGRSAKNYFQNRAKQAPFFFYGFSYSLKVSPPLSFCLFWLYYARMTIDPNIITALQKKLTDEKNRLESLLASLAKKDPAVAGDYDTPFPEMGTGIEESQDEVEEYENLTSAEHELENRLSSITAALAKIERGTYGQCTVCREDIPLERLHANPEASSCAAHAQ